MKRNATIEVHEPSEAEIQHAAYLLWIEEGQPEGRDQEHWFAAKQLLLHRHGRNGKTRQRSPEIAAPAQKAALAATH
jgi:hypothetical protein